MAKEERIADLPVEVQEHLTRALIAERNGEHEQAEQELQAAISKEEVAIATGTDASSKRRPLDLQAAKREFVNLEPEDAAVPQFPKECPHCLGIGNCACDSCDKGYCSRCWGTGINRYMDNQ